jgi:hypothetical protein
MNNNPTLTEAISEIKEAIKQITFKEFCQVVLNVRFWTELLPNRILATASPDHPAAIIAFVILFARSKLQHMYVLSRIVK